MVSDHQHQIDAFAEKRRAEEQLHEALLAQAKLGRPATLEEQDALDTLTFAAETGHRRWVETLPVPLGKQ